MEQKVKNEGRVAWGKKLAQMSKEAKEKKKKLNEASSTEKSEDSKPHALKPESSKEKSQNITYLLLTAGGVFLVYMLYNKPKVSVLKGPNIKDETVTPKPLAQEIKLDYSKASTSCYDYRTF